MSQTNQSASGQQDDSFLNNYAEYGTDEVYSTIPYLSITQSVTKAGLEQGKEPGGFWHTGLNKSFGERVKVIPLGWQDVWLEKGSKGRTVAVHRNMSKLEERGSGKSYKIINPETGRKVDHTYVVILNIVGEPDSTCLFTPSVKSSNVMRKWRNSLSMCRLSNGRKAPIFKYEWELSTKLEVNGENEYYVLYRALRGSMVTQEYVLEYVTPLIEMARKPILLIESSIRKEEEVEAEDAIIEDEDEETTASEVDLS